MKKKPETKIIAKTASAKRQKKQPVYCLWANVKYSPGAIHEHNEMSYRCDNKGYWMPC